MSFVDLPVELVLRIGSFVSTPDLLLGLRGVSKGCRALSEDLLVQQRAEPMAASLQRKVATHPRALASAPASAPAFGLAPARPPAQAVLRAWSPTRRAALPSLGVDALLAAPQGVWARCLRRSRTFLLCGSDEAWPRIQALMPYFAAVEHLQCERRVPRFAAAAWVPPQWPQLCSGEGLEVGAWLQFFGVALRSCDLRSYALFSPTPMASLGERPVHTSRRAEQVLDGVADPGTFFPLRADFAALERARFFLPAGPDWVQDTEQQLGAGTASMYWALGHLAQLALVLQGNALPLLREVSVVLPYPGHLSRQPGSASVWASLAALAGALLQPRQDWTRQNLEPSWGLPAYAAHSAAALLSVRDLLCHGLDSRPQLTSWLFELRCGEDWDNEAIDAGLRLLGEVFHHPKVRAVSERPDALWRHSTVTLLPSPKASAPADAAGGAAELSAWVAVAVAGDHA